MPKAVFASVERVKSSDMEANADLFMFFKNKGWEGILLKVKRRPILLELLVSKGSYSCMERVGAR